MCGEGGGGGCVGPGCWWGLLKLHDCPFVRGERFVIKRLRFDHLVTGMR